jgi:hypothetical protein
MRVALANIYGKRGMTDHHGHVTDRPASQNARRTEQPEATPILAGGVPRAVIDAMPVGVVAIVRTEAI